MQDVVTVENLGKRFRLFRADRPRTLHETLLRGFQSLTPSEYFWGLHDVSFRIAPGRMVGVVGRNGAGKSTLLRLIGGVGRPDRGRVRIHGRVGALLNLGVGFHSELTGLENIYISGVIGGLTRAEVSARLDSIVAFSELEEYLDSPLRIYSTGMQMRLAFSVAIHAQPDVLLIDEVLGVGDYSFQRKCIDKIGLLKANGCAVILVSHEASTVQEMCEDTIWLRSGQLAAYGPSVSVINQYLAETDLESRDHRRVARSTVAVIDSSEETALTRARGPSHENDFTAAPVQITGVRLLDPSNTVIAEMNSGAALTVEVSYRASRTVDVLNFRVYFERDDGTSCVDLNTRSSGAGLADVRGEGQVWLQIGQLNLTGGTYVIDVSAFGQDSSVGYDYRRDMGSFTVRPTGIGIGILRPPHRWEVKGVAGGEGQGFRP